MRALVVSDLHLGARTADPVLADPSARAALARAAREAGRVVLLGDLLELRHGPVGEALAAARPVLAAVGAALGPAGSVVVVPGNHDHCLLTSWLERRVSEGRPLGLEERVTPQAAGWLAEAVADALAPARVELAYPGTWLREDVYAHHGHYLDAHTTVPTFERLAIGALVRFAGAGIPAPAGPDDYEAALAPVYAWLHALAQRARPGAPARGTGASARVWAVLEGSRPLRARGLAGALTVAVAGLNRAGVGPLRPDVSGPALRRANLRAMGEVVARLGVSAGQVLFGHTHRSGPWPGDDEAEWAAPTGARLINVGSWVRESWRNPRGAPSPHAPGTVVEVDAAGPPRLRRLLPVE